MGEASVRAVAVWAIAILAGCAGATHENQGEFYVAHSPFIWSRHGSKDSDIPLMMFVHHDKQMNEFTYNVIFSNEDGGTGLMPAMLLSKYGRFADIEWVYSVRLDGGGNIISEKFQGSGHESKDFRGTRIGTHPVLAVATTNNNMSDEVSETDKMYRLVPVLTEKDGEQLMDENPWICRVSNEEMFREKKAEEPGNPLTPVPSDLRNYLYIDFEGSGGGQFGVRVGGRWYVNDYNLPMLRFSSSRGRTSIELPPGTKPRDIEETKFPAGKTRAFMLDRDFVPVEVEHK